MAIRWTKLGGQAGFIEQLPRGNNDYSLESLEDGSAITLTDLSRNVVFPAMNYNMAAGTVGGSTSVVARDFGYVLKLKTTAIEVRKDALATVGTAPDDNLEMTGWVMMAEDAEGTDSEVRVLDDITYAFTGTGTTTTPTVDTDFSVASPIPAKVVFIPRGCWGANSTRYDGSAFLYAEIDASTSALTLTRGATNQDTDGEGSRVWFQGDKWKVHRRKITGPITWAGGTPDGTPNYLDLDMYENATGVAGTISNPSFGNMVYARVWIKEPTASNSDTRKPLNYSYGVEAGASGQARLVRPSDNANLLESSDVEILVEVVTHADVETTTDEILRGPDYHPTALAHDGSIIGLSLDESFAGAANDQVFVNLSTLSDQSVANNTVRGFMYTGVVNNESIEIRQPGNSPLANYRISAICSNWSNVESAAAGLPIYGATADSWNGEITVSGEVHPGGTITTMEITGADASVVVLTAEGGADSQNAVFDLSDLYYDGGAFEQIPWDTPLDFIIKATASVSAVGQISIPSPTTGQVQVAGADRTALSAGGATDSLLVKMFDATAFDTNSGSVFWNETGNLNEFGIPNTLTAGDAISIRRFENGWSSVYTKNDFVDAAESAADIDEQFGAIGAGNYTWQAPALNFDSIQWTSDGSCLTAGTKGTPLAPPIPLSRIIWTSPVLNDDLIWCEVAIASPTSSDMISPALVQADGAGYAILLAGGATVNRFDLIRFDVAGNVTGIDNTGTLPFFVSSGVVIRLEYSNINGSLTIKVANSAVLTIDDPTYQPTLACLAARGLNTNSTCALFLRARGKTPRSIIRVNGSATPPSVTNGAALTIRWSETYNNASYTITDNRGNQQAHAATATATDLDTLTLNIGALRHGRLTVAASSGEQVLIDYPAPAGKQVANLDAAGPLSLTGQNAQWLADSQLRFNVLSVEGNVASVSKFGNIFVAGGFIANVDVEEHRAGAWLAAVRHTIFRGIDEDFTPILDVNVLNGQGHSLDLTDYFNLTAGLDQSIPGTVGTLTIDDSGTLAAVGLTETAGVISGTVSAADGTYPVTIDITDPAGNTQQAAWNYVVGAQGGGDQTAPVVLLATCTALGPTVLALTVTVETPSVLFNLYVIAVPVGSPAASEAQIKAGQDANGDLAPNASLTAPPGAPAGVAISGLTPGTAYEKQYVVEDSNSMVTTLGLLDNGGIGFFTLGAPSGRGGGGRKRRRPKPS